MRASGDALPQICNGYYTCIRGQNPIFPCLHLPDLPWAHTRSCDYSSAGHAQLRMPATTSSREKGHLASYPGLFQLIRILYFYQYLGIYRLLFVLFSRVVCVWRPLLFTLFLLHAP
jgi:hypothetical protein